MVQQFVPGGTDLLSAASGYTYQRDEKPVNEFHYYPIAGVDNAWTWEYIQRDRSGGLNKVNGQLLSGDAGPDSHRLASSTLYTAYPGETTIPFVTTDFDGTGTIGAHNGNFLSWVEQAGVMVIGNGSANVLWYGNAASDTLAASAYDPGGNVVSHLGSIVIGGVTNARRLVVGRLGAAAQVLSGATFGTTDGTMHANTAYLYHIFTSELNASAPGVPVHGLMANGHLYTIPATAAIGDAPTQTASLNNGGYGVDMWTLPNGGWPARAFMVIPKEQNSNGMFAAAEPDAATLMHCSLEFNDPQELGSVPMRKPIFAQRWGNVLVVSDGVLAWMYDGQSWTNLRWVTEREPNSLISYRICGFWEYFGTLFALSMRRDDSVGTNTRLAIERYDPAEKAWHQVSGTGVGSSSTTSGTKGRYQMGTKYSLYPTGKGLPVNTARQTLYWYPLDTVHYVYQAQPTPNTSPFNSLGPSEATEATGTAKMAALLMPPLPGGGHGIHVIETVEIDGDVPAGGSTAQVQIQLATQTATGFSFSNNLKATISAADRVMRRATPFPDNNAFFSHLCAQIVITTATRTPRVGTVTYRGIAYGRGRTPVSPRAFWKSVGKKVTY